ncbi:MAG: SIS domain-containing protein [Candidatus Brocadiia bacterium]
MKETIEKILRRSAEVHNQLAENAESVLKFVNIILKHMQNGATLYVMGNGGSAADAQHLAGELVGRFERERQGLPCVALTTDTSVLTAVSNDYGGSAIFTRQVEALVKEGDIVLGISTSGNSQNVLEALELARKKGACTVGLTGEDGHKMEAFCDGILCVPAHKTARIQEAHGIIIHILCGILEETLGGL